jgi:hypothetical protein
MEECFLRPQFYTGKGRTQLWLMRLNFGEKPAPDVDLKYKMNTPDTTELSLIPFCPDYHDNGGLPHTSSLSFSP